MSELKEKKKPTSSSPSATAGSLIFQTGWSGSTNGALPTEVIDGTSCDTFMPLNCMQVSHCI
jgi:hypothetical protein